MFPSNTYVVKELVFRLGVLAGLSALIIVHALIYRRDSLHARLLRVELPRCSLARRIFNQVTQHHLASLIINFFPRLRLWQYYLVQLAGLKSIGDFCYLEKSFIVVESRVGLLVDFLLRFLCTVKFFKGMFWEGLITLMTSVSIDLKAVSVLQTEIMLMSLEKDSVAMFFITECHFPSNGLQSSRAPSSYRLSQSFYCSDVFSYDPVPFICASMICLHLRPLGVIFMLGILLRQTWLKTLAWLASNRLALLRKLLSDASAESEFLVFNFSCLYSLQSRDGISSSTCYYDVPPQFIIRCSLV